ncbi:MAG: alkaline phosphatase family protein [Candidatus Thermoplasmatota archaeon]|nr:alkaline phosphatase family protein [Candidatus Thermoplasmatota archaeon]
MDDGNPLIGIAAVGNGQAATLMSVAPTVLSSLNITSALTEPPMTRAMVRRVVVLELDGLGWGLFQQRAPLLRNVSSLGNLSSALTAFPPRTPTGTAMALTGHDMLHNGILSSNDRTLSQPTFLEIAEGTGLSTVWIEGDRSILSSETELNVDTNGDGSVDNEIFGSLIDRLDDGTDVVLAHFHSIDDEFHRTGSGSEGLALAMSRIDSYIGQVVEMLEASSTPSMLMLFSDHGLHDVSGGMGEHGSFRHEDMYAITAYRTFGTHAVEVLPSISIIWGGSVMEVMDLEELEAMPYLEESYAIRSSHGEVTSLFRGVMVHDLIELKAGSLQFTSLTFSAGDGFSLSLPWEWAEEGAGTIIAYRQDGAPLAGGEGPFRLVVPQELAGEYNGQYCLKDVTKVEVVA